MKVNKVYIIKINSAISHKYAAIAAESCEKIGLKWEYYYGHEFKNADELWNNNHFGIKKWSNMTDAYASITQTHFDLWKKIYDNKECAIILEHDAIMIKNIKKDIPDGYIVNLGYKILSPHKYMPTNLNQESNFIKIKKHNGTHAYAINHKTAKILLDELKLIGEDVFTLKDSNSIDDVFFIKRTSKVSGVPLLMTDPICALGWIRQTTRKEGNPDEPAPLDNLGIFSSGFNFNLTKSFKLAYKGKIRIDRKDLNKFYIGK